MNITVHKAEERGVGEHGWLSTRYSFSFSSWYNPERMGFGALRVLNDDQIAPGAGFPPHAHKDMEIITIVTEGAVAHKDSTGSEGVVRAGEVQVMSAGSGVVHSEYNASDTEPLTLFQLWIETAQQGVTPRYAQRAYDTAKDSVCIVAPIDSSESVAGTALGIHQRAYITRVRIPANESHTYTRMLEGNGVYVFVISGDVLIEKTALHTRDALGIEDGTALEIYANDTAELLVIEVPL